jgi:hypothetical protein
MKKSFTVKSLLSLFLIITVFTSLALQSCSTSGSDKDQIMFMYVDPLEKGLAEASYFTEKEAVSDVARGEHATLQFIVRSPYNIKNLRTPLEASDGQTVC